MSYSLSSGHSVRLGGLSPLRIYFSLRTEMSKHRPRTEARRWQGPLYNTVRTPTVKTVWGTKDHIHIYIYMCVCCLGCIFVWSMYLNMMCAFLKCDYIMLLCILCTRMCGILHKCIWAENSYTTMCTNEIVFKSFAPLTYTRNVWVVCDRSYRIKEFVLTHQLTSE